MKLRYLAMFLAVLSFAAMSGTPPTTAPAATPTTTPATPASSEIRQAPTEVRVPPSMTLMVNRPASWQTVENAKLSYNVFRSYAPADLVPQLDQPVTNAAYRDLITRRAAAFRSGTRALRLALDPKTIIDAGATRADDAGTVVLVDLARSPGLLDSIKADIARQPNLRLEANEEKNYVIPTLATAVASDGTAGYRSSDNLMVTIAAKDHSRVTVLRMDKGQWKTVSDTTRPTVVLSPKALRDKVLETRRGVYYRGYEKLAIVSPAILQTRVKNVDIENLLSIGQLQGTSPSQPGSGSGAIPPPQDPMEPAPPPPVRTYTSFGVTPTCSRQCAQANCFGCCAAVMSAEHSAIVAAGFACHMSSDLCPWCHIGCAVMVSAMWLTAAAHDTTCVVGCTIRSEIPVSRGNPNNCPVH